MISKRELDGAIYECENAPVSYRTCEKLATFYTLREYAFKEESTPDCGYSYDEPQGIGDYGESDFLQAVKGRSEGEILAVMDELMETILITNPRLYQGVMRKIKGQI